MSGLMSTLAIVWRIAIPYFRSEDRWAGRVLLAAVILIELGLVSINVLLNQWNNRFYNALQERNWDAFVSELLYFCVLAAIFIVLAVYQLYLNQWLQIRWRRFMTSRYLSEWLDAANHYRMQLTGDAADNPDQRIADDIKQFVESTLSIGVGLLSSIVTLGSFVVILWALSAQAPLRLFGVDVGIPGYLVWAALIYAILGTLITHWIGKPLIGLNFQQQRYEADFRFNLVRVRENGEQIALLKGETAERQRLMDRFAFVITNWMAIMTRQKRLTTFTAGYGQVSSVFPFLVVSPAYFANAVQLGGLMQTASAFSSVQGALSFFVSTYRQIADWRAVVARLDGFETAVAVGKQVAVDEPVIHVVRNEMARHIDRRSRPPAAEWSAPRDRLRHRDIAARSRPCQRAVRFRQIHVAAGDFRHLAVRKRHGDNAQGRQGDGPAAATVLAYRHFARRHRLSGARGSVRCGSDARGYCGRRPARARGTTHRGGALESHAVAWRAATARDGAGPAACAGLPVSG